MLPVKDVSQRGFSEKPNPPDKPLPSLPFATVQTQSPIVRRSLIDASDKPLRRSISPSPGEKDKQEWPALFPSRPTTPHTIQETVHDSSSKQAGSSTLNSSESNPDLAGRHHQHGDDRRHGPETPATGFPTRRQGFQGGGAARTQKPSTTVQARLALEATVERPVPGSEPSSCVPDDAESTPRALNRETPNAGTPAEIDLASISGPGAALNTSNNNLSSPIGQHARSSQDGANAKASRLPKRLSAPGPVCSSNSPRRTLSERLSPYDTISPHVSRAPPVKHEHPSSSAKRVAEPTKAQHASRAVCAADFAQDEVPLLIAVKQLSKQSQAKGGRSSIPRPRLPFQLRQDAESESDILVSKLPRKELNSNRVTADHESDDGDLDTDEGREEKENKKDPQAFHPPNEAKQNSQILDDGRGNIGHNDEAASFKEAGKSVLPTLMVPPDGGISSATSDSHQDKKGPSASIDGAYLRTTHHGHLVDEPFNRVKRLSATSPEHGPILRISDSADRIIMGYGSEEDLDDDDTTARKRNSVPDLRRSVIIQELRKSTEGLLNGHLPLSRSATTRSLTRQELKEQVNETRDVRQPRVCQSEAQSVLVKPNSSIPEDPFSGSNIGQTKVDTNSIARKPLPSPNGPLEWPLRTSPQAPAELHPVKEDSSEEGTSWISPLYAPRMVPEEKSLSPMTNGQASRSGETKTSESASKAPQHQNSHRLGEIDVNSLAIPHNSMPAISNGVRSSAQKNAQFPPRTSSRANTPDISARTRAQITLPYTREIPNRFQSAHPRRLSEEFSLPARVTVDPETLRNSIYKLKSPEMSKTSTPATREQGRAQLSSAKGMLSNFKGLFHKRSMDAPTASSTAKARVPTPIERHAMTSLNGSPYPHYHSRTLPATYGACKMTRGGAAVVSTPKDAFPPVASSREPCSGLDKDNVHQATDLAMRVLDAARTERDPLKSAKLLQVCAAINCLNRSC